MLKHTVIRFDHVTEVFDLPVLRLNGAFAILLQLSDGLAIASGLIRIDYGRPVPCLAAAQSLPQKALG